MEPVGGHFGKRCVISDAVLPELNEGFISILHNSLNIIAYFKVTVRPKNTM
jgi:hypothetical protein